MARSHRLTAIALSAGLALGLGSTAASAQDDGELAACVELTNDADGNRSFSDEEVAPAAGDIAHQVTIDNCGDWDATVEVVVARLLGGEVAVCSAMEGGSLPVDGRITCEFELPADGDGGTTEVVVTLARADGGDGTVEGSDETSFTIGAASDPEPTEEPTPEDTGTEDDAPEDTGTEDDATEDENAEAMDDDLPATGVDTDLWLFGMALTLLGFLLVDAGRRGHLAIPVRGDVSRRVEPNPLILAARTARSQHRWIFGDLKRRRR